MRNQLIGYIVLFVLAIGIYLQSNVDVIAMESEELISKMVSNDSVVAYKAAWALGETKDPKAIKPLIKSLEKDDLRLAASMALVHYGQSVAGQIRPLLNSDQWYLKKWAIWILGRLCDKESIPIIIKLLNDKEDIVRLRSAWALGQMSDESAVTALIRTSKEDKNEAVRKQAKMSLGNIPKLKGKIVIKNPPAWLLVAQDLPQAELNNDYMLTLE